MKKKTITVLAVLAIVVAALGACGGSDESSSKDTNMETSTEITTEVVVESEVPEEITVADTSYTLGDTVTLIDSDNNTFDVTVTGCNPVFNGTENVTAVYYTVTLVSGDNLVTGNPWFDMYADNQYVEAGNWEDWTPFTSAKLKEGMTFEGCYIGDVDYNKVSDIQVFVNETEWDINVESVSTETSESVVTSNVEQSGDYLDWAGLYTDGNSSVEINMYSSPEDESCGNMHAVIEDYGEINCEIQYYDEDMIILAVDSDQLVTIYCDDEGDNNKQITMTITDPDISDTIYAGPLVMTEHYES